MSSLQRPRFGSILSLLGGSLEFSIVLPETFRPPIVPGAIFLLLLSLIIIFSGIMLYSSPKLHNVWATLAMAMALLVIMVGSPSEGFELLAPPMVLTGSILTILDQMSTSKQSV
jgi:hypothetical protein